MTAAGKVPPAKILVLGEKSEKNNTIQYNTIQYNTIQYNTIQCNAMQYNTIQCNAMQYNATQCNTTLYWTMYLRTLHVPALL